MSTRAWSWRRCSGSSSPPRCGGLYFDVVALVATRRLGQVAEGRERNEMARDSYSYLHYAMVAGIVLVALGLKKTLAHVGDPLTTETAVAMLGGAALYLLAHIAFRLRNVGTAEQAAPGLRRSSSSRWCRSPSTWRRSRRSRSWPPCSRR